MRVPEAIAAAFEMGYRQHEKGHNLQRAFGELAKCYEGPEPQPESWETKYKLLRRVVKSYLLMGSTDGNPLRQKHRKTLEELCQSK